MSNAVKAEARVSKSSQEILESASFKHLVARRWSMSLMLLTFLFVLYYGFITLVATNREFVSQKIGEVTTLGIPLAIGVIVISFGLTAWYIAWANRSYDPEVERLKGQLKP